MGQEKKRQEVPHQQQNPSDQVWSLINLEFLLIWPVLGPTHGSLPLDPLIYIPKGLSSKMTLEVAPRALEFRISNA